VWSIFGDRHTASDHGEEYRSQVEQFHSGRIWRVSQGYTPSVKQFRQSEQNENMNDGDSE
jgi:hypothetical protein